MQSVPCNITEQPADEIIGTTESLEGAQAASFLLLQMLLLTHSLVPKSQDELPEEPFVLQGKRGEGKRRKEITGTLL